MSLREDEVVLGTIFSGELTHIWGRKIVYEGLSPNELLFMCSW